MLPHDFDELPAGAIYLDNDSRNHVGEAFTVKVRCVHVQARVEPYRGEQVWGVTLDDLTTGHRLGTATLEGSQYTVAQFAAGLVAGVVTALGVTPTLPSRALLKTGLA